MEMELSKSPALKKHGDLLHLDVDFEKLAQVFQHRMGRSGQAVLKRMKDYLKRAERPSAATLDKLALLAGFQSWHDLDDALHGEGKDVMGEEAFEGKKVRG